MLSADGKLLAEFKPSQPRMGQASRTISPNVVDALIATEDQRFYQHHGIDLRRTASARAAYVFGRPAGRLDASRSSSRAICIPRRSAARRRSRASSRKRSPRSRSKRSTPRTRSSRPTSTRCRSSTTRTASRWPRAPTSTNRRPSSTCSKARRSSACSRATATTTRCSIPSARCERRNIVLGQMVKYGKLARREATTRSRRVRCASTSSARPKTPGRAPHFAQQLRKWLIDWADDNDYNIYSDGLVVRTTIDSRLQTMATQARRAGRAISCKSIANAAWGGRARAARARTRISLHAFMRETADYRARAATPALNDADAHQAARRRTARSCRRCARTRRACRPRFVAMDPRNGQIKAWVGSRDFSAGPVRSRRAGAPPAGLDLQAVRLRRGVRARREARPTRSSIRPVEIPLRGGEIWRPTDDVAAERPRR